MNQPLPVTILGGYLGAGKTTLVNQMLRQANGRRIAVLVNEFGTLPIDEDLIEARDDSLISIAGGCICCSFGSDLTAALQQMTTLDPPPDHIVIESSGVALPGAIAASVALNPALHHQGVCVLADCLTVREQAKDEYIGDTITRQIDDADIVVLTKTDLAEVANSASALAWLAEHWPAKHIVTADNGVVANADLLADISRAPSRPSGAVHGNEAYSSITLYPTSTGDTTAFAKALCAPSLGILRAKGYLHDMSGKKMLLQIVGTRYALTETTSKEAPGVVCIGLKQRFDKPAIIRLAEEIAARKGA